MPWSLGSTRPIIHDAGRRNPSHTRSWDQEGCSRAPRAPGPCGPWRWRASVNTFPCGAFERRCNGPPTRTRHPMNVALWILQLVLAAVFAAHGWLFLSPPASVAVQMNASLPRWFQLFMGGAEIAAAAGLILPAVTRIQPQLVPAAGGGIILVMISATIWHLGRSEWSSAGITAVLLVIATLVTYQRWRVRPIPPREARSERR